MLPVDDAVRAAIAAIEGAIGVACSGGVDSMALAHAVIAAGEGRNVVIVHVDHGLREDSAAIAAAVAGWATGQGVGAEVRRVTVEPGASLEDAARRARYAALDAVIAERQLAALLTAHTARDQAETVMLRVLRGTGPAGLAGIPRRRGAYVRPLLGIARAATEAYVAAHALPTWPDPMNDDPRFARVRMRQLWPALVAENPALDQALARLAKSAAEWAEVIDALAALLAPTSEGFACAALAGAPAAVAKRALARAAEAAGLSLGADHLDAVLALAARATAGTVAIDVPGGRATRTYDHLRFTAEGTAAADPASAPELDVRGAPGPIAIRAVQPGDRMRPARLRGRSRKLSDLYVDARVPREARQRARVVVDAATGEILWAEHVGSAFGFTVEVTPRPARNLG